MSSEPCPNCSNELVYDHYTDSMKCLFCNYKHALAVPYYIKDGEKESNEGAGYSTLTLSDDDDVGYGQLVEDW